MSWAEDRAVRRRVAAGRGMPLGDVEAAASAVAKGQSVLLDRGGESVRRGAAASAVPQGRGGRGRGAKWELVLPLVLVFGACLVHRRRSASRKPQLARRRQDHPV